MYNYVELDDDAIGVLVDMFRYQLKGVSVSDSYAWRGFVEVVAEWLGSPDGDDWETRKEAFIARVYA